MQNVALAAICRSCIRYPSLSALAIQLRRSNNGTPDRPFSSGCNFLDFDSAADALHVSWRTSLLEADKDLWLPLFLRRHGFFLKTSRCTIQLTPLRLHSVASTPFHHFHRTLYRQMRPLSDRILHRRRRAHVGGRSDTQHAQRFPRFSRRSSPYGRL
ncbi:hypothetical protein HYPSUDRAFT_1055730 [Hypholoma sublateritium FD-334 SS-4]|uniref:Uncharacterized protein n=1 Tax=Hypholoma sublateritium (strain FD-334 SS-4) TaxID=945553 RepID=A0A0D2NCN0_HYPSF|nr:hypothetical protein HYPSUDRAFT_1055730 [Hypholoma sublateritium FD-334 SS-4]